MVNPHLDPQYADRLAEAAQARNRPPEWYTASQLAAETLTYSGAGKPPAPQVTFCDSMLGLTEDNLKRIFALRENLEKLTERLFGTVGRGSGTEAPAHVPGALPGMLAMAGQTSALIFQVEELFSELASRL